MCGFGIKNKDGSEKPKLVLVHGYGGSGALFFKIIKPISEFF